MENEQRKRDAVTHISPEEAARRTGCSADGTKVSPKRKEEEHIREWWKEQWPIGEYLCRHVANEGET